MSGSSVLCVCILTVVIEAANEVEPYYTKPNYHESETSGYINGSLNVTLYVFIVAIIVVWVY